MASELVRELSLLGATVDVAVFDNAGKGDRTILDAAAPYIRAGDVLPCSGRWDPETIGALRRHVSEQRIDIVHSHKFKGTLYFLLSRLRRECGLVATFHNWLKDTAVLRLHAALDKRLARYCDIAVGVSQSVASELRRYVPASRVRKVGNGVDTERFQRKASREVARRELNLPAERILVGFVGRLTAQKGVSVLLRATAGLPAKLQDSIDLVIVGDGEERSALSDEARALGLGNRTHFLGTQTDTPLVYAALDLFVLPSEQEAFPMVVLEAMACELPLIATDVGDTAQIVEPGVSGLIVQTRNVESLRQAIGAMLSDPERAACLGRAARQRVVAHFSSRAMASTYLSLYEEVMRARPRR